MRSSRASLGAPLAGLAAVVLAIDLWAPWYALRLPRALLEQMDALSGGLGGYLHAGLAYARRAGPIPLSAHDVFHAVDFELVLIAVAVIGIIAAGRARGRPVLASGDGGALAALGALAFCLVGYRILVPPAPSGLIALRPGIWVGLGAAALICGGGLLSRQPAEPSPAGRPGAPPPEPTW